ncbi:hypothetical protein ACFQZC_19295 [Streptacidiphilus monticola]
MADTSDYATVWARVVERLGNDPNVEAMDRKWIQRTHLIGTMGGTALLATPNEYAKQILESRLFQPISEQLSHELQQPMRIAVIVDANAAPAPAPLPQQPPAPGPSYGGGYGSPSPTPGYFGGYPQQPAQPAYHQPYSEPQPYPETPLYQEPGYHQETGYPEPPSFGDPQQDEWAPQPLLPLPLAAWSRGTRSRAGSGGAAAGLCAAAARPGP